MKLLLQFIFLLIGLSLSAQNLSEITYGQESTFEIITWNIEKFPKSGTITRDSVAIIVKALDADLIALQEISSKSHFNTLLDALPEFDGFYDPDYYGGLAYIYKKNTVEIIEVKEIYSNNQYWNAFPRAPFVVEFKFKGRTMFCLNNHLKCCGNGDLDLSDESDEETRRYRAINYIKDYLEDELAGERVFLVGDFNDELTDNINDNVFRKLLDNPDDYVFTDMEIAEGNSFDWSYPNWPSHLDHIMVTNELFSALEDSNSETTVIRIENFMGGFTTYDSKISDHRPVGLKLDAGIISSIEDEKLLVERSIFVYPNPAGDYALVELSTIYGEAKLKIYDNIGQLIQSISVDKGEQLISLDLSEYAEGLYFLNIETQERDVRISTPFVVARN